MRRILGWICMLGAVLALSSAAGEGRAYSDVLAEWKDIPPASSAAVHSCCGP